MASGTADRSQPADLAGTERRPSRSDARVATMLNRFGPKSHLETSNMLHPHRESPSPYRGHLAVPSPIPSTLSEEDPEEAPVGKTAAPGRRSEAQRRQTLIRLLLSSVQEGTEEEGDMLKKHLTWAAGLSLEASEEAKLLRKDSGVTPEETMLRLRKLSLRRRRQSLMSSRASSVRQAIHTQIHTPQQIRRRWRKAVRAVQLVLVATRARKEYMERMSNRLKSFGQLQAEIALNAKVTGPAQGEHGRPDLSFDPSIFKANPVLELPQDVQDALKTNPAYRRPEQISKALRALCVASEAFAQLPVHMREQLVKVGWYDSFETNRIIVREGHDPTSVYFILNGKASSTRVETDLVTGKPYVRTMGFLKAGSYFGDHAILQGVPHNQTIVCSERVYLIAVEKENFIESVMDKTSGREPKHITFLRSVYSLQDWPMGALPHGDHSIWYYKHFRKDQVMCPDSSQSEWVYVIKSGKCKVLKKTLLSRKLNTRQASPWVSAARPLPSISSTAGRNALRNHEGPLYRRPSTVPHHCEASSHLIPPKTAPPKTDLSSGRAFVTDLARTTAGRRGWQSRVRQTFHAEKTSAPRISVTDEAVHSHRNIIQEETDRFHSNRRSQGEEEDHDAFFLHIQTLGEKDIFGLTSIMHEETSGFSLVSEGCECVVIAKEFFRDHVTEELKRRLRITLRPPPTDDDIMRVLHEQHAWERYKADCSAIAVQQVSPLRLVTRPQST
ncbi:CNBD2 [Branchiostoma lanceolatum]|uniref:CNBD2 protein n=2 Tax=Branchiostoma lanceolatum TaxID=7740 RepID=A0A8J9YPS7_BRALA|nr:CNBD2 [Branchiostoma lanceolatum]